MRLRKVQVHLIAIEVRVVRSSHSQVETQRGEGHHLRTVSHHGHLVQGRLPIEDDVVSVQHVPLHLPPILQVDAREVRNVPQVHTGTVLADDVLRSRPRGGPIVHHVLQPVEVERRHALRECQVQRHGPRHAHLLRVQVRVPSDDAPCAVIHPLAHEGSAEPSFLGLQTLADRFQRPLRLGCGLRNANDLVVTEGEDVVLQELHELHAYMLPSSRFHLCLQHLVCLDDVHELRGDVILTPHRAHGDRGPDVHGRNGQMRKDHLCGWIPLRAKAHAFYVLVADSLEDREDFVRSQCSLSVLA
mmetsp:Transcript_62745/g.178202  ORF Transcript_62745/g.178202 Transcript_62745/m.178202 type:complete len:301 (+) Transcript_62745:4623-5525(+)